MRNNGCVNLIVDGFIISGLPAVVKPDPGVFVSVGYNGYFNGTQNYGQYKLPSDCQQVFMIRQRVTGSNLQFVPMLQAPAGLASGYQNNWLGMWEWRNFAIYMNGSTLVQDIMLRYSNQPPSVNPPVADFAETNLGVIDSTTALATYMAYLYGVSRGSDAQLRTEVKGLSDEALSGMVLEYVRREQTLNYARPSYKDGGSENYHNTTLGTTGTVG